MGKGFGFKMQSCTQTKIENKYEVLKMIGLK
jgi:hypothetical protein